jgi:hypothetical protein
MFFVLDVRADIAQEAKKPPGDRCEFSALATLTLRSAMLKRRGTL